MIRIIIVEDDILFSSYLEKELNDIGKYKIIKVANNVTDALVNIRRELPDVAIVDIKLQGQGTGIDLAEILTEYHIPIVFISSSIEKDVYDATHAMDLHCYLVKPFHVLTLDSAIINLLQLKELNTYGGNLTYRNGAIRQRIPFKDIKYILSDGNYCTVFTAVKKYIFKLSLTKMLKELDADEFLQVHKKCIVNKNYILNIDFKKNIVDLGEFQFSLGRVYRQNAQKLFGK
jgi:DNA-binding LytR/AlgR family response regulator